MSRCRHVALTSWKQRLSISNSCNVADDNEICNRPTWPASLTCTWFCKNIKTFMGLRSTVYVGIRTLADLQNFNISIIVTSDYQ